MKEAPFEPPQNYSQIKAEGELSPFRDPESGFSRYVDKADKFHFRISEFGFENEEQPRQKQMVTQQLASLVVPVASVYKTEVDGMKDYFSVDIHNHPEFKDDMKTFSIVDDTFLQIMFDDVDHSRLHNHEGGVFYDFNVASLLKIDGSLASGWNDVLRTIRKNPKDLQELKQKLQFFKQHIEGEDGLKFIQDTCRHAEYTEISPEEIQSNLLERSDIFLKQIEEITR